MPDTYTVTLTPGALADIDRLDQFLREKNPAAANKMLVALETTFLHLSENPFAGPAFSTSTLRARTVRFGKGGHIYLYDIRGPSVVVARLFHAREDWWGKGAGRDGRAE